MKSYKAVPLPCQDNISPARVSALRVFSSTQLESLIIKQSAWSRASAGPGDFFSRSLGTLVYEIFNLLNRQWVWGICLFDVFDLSSTLKSFSLSPAASPDYQLLNESKRLFQVLTTPSFFFKETINSQRHKPTFTHHLPEDTFGRR